MPAEIRNTAVTHQNVRLSRGMHRSPDDGACVVELASMLASEPFSDHPRAVCPVIASYMRTVNDRIPVDDLPELYPFAAAIVGTRGTQGAAGARPRMRPLGDRPRRRPSNRLPLVRTPLGLGRQRGRLALRAGGPGAGRPRPGADAARVAPRQGAGRGPRSAPAVPRLLAFRRFSAEVAAAARGRAGERAVEVQLSFLEAHLVGGGRAPVPA